MANWDRSMDYDIAKYGASEYGGPKYCRVHTKEEMVDEVCDLCEEGADQAEDEDAA